MEKLRVVVIIVIVQITVYDYYHISGADLAQKRY